ncbi:MAG: gamma carbonic anhydrase family protein [Spirochaetales bacterium]|nr:gamma carbonic anhydrase family protein [Spirochaetales bacterium]
MIISYKDKKPAIAHDASVFESADIIGDVTISSACTVWSNASIRGDLASVTLRKGSNIQDNAVIHVDIDTPTDIGEYVTVGHAAIIHGCTIGDHSLIGMGAVILNKAVIGENSLVGAGALVTSGKIFPPNSLIIGSPAKAVRKVTNEELEYMKKNAYEYISLGKEFKNQSGG